MESSFLESFLAAAEILTSKKNPDVITQHGVGYVIKDFGVSRFSFEFTSMLGFISKNGIMMSKMPERIARSGAWSTSENGKRDHLEFNYCVQMQLQHSYGSHPFYKHLVAYRSRFTSKKISLDEVKF